MDLTVNLKPLAFECGLDEHEKEQLHLRARSAGLTVCGCVHGVFVCKLVHSLKGEIQRHIAKGNSLASEEGSGLSVGILGMGHIGKQLALMLLERTGIKPSHIQISTRRPETSVQFSQKGIECYFDNRRLAAWADVLFLCCLPSHIPKICADLASHLPKHCLVYSYISAIPVKRLAQLLGHNFILKPQYQFDASDCADLWLTQSHLPMALNDPMLMEASCPLAMSGGFSLGVEWVCAVLYALLNICTSANLASTQALLLINNLFPLKGPHTEEFIVESFVNSSCALSLASTEPFPWIHLVDTQTKDTPLSVFVLRRKYIQDSISTVYKSLLESSQK